MAKKTVLIDVRTAGASGDMFLSALIDIIEDEDALVPVAASLLVYDPTLRIKLSKQTSADVGGKHLKITHDPGIRFDPISIQEVLETVSEEIELSSAAKDFAIKALNEILQAESRAHDKPLEELHLHETGSPDTILDIAGTAYLLDKMGLFDTAKFMATEVAVGSGKIQTEHGELKVPVPAVAEMIAANDVPFHLADAKTEILTPTGAAILVTLAEEYVESSEGFKSSQQGIGIGSRDLGAIPNALKILIGEFEKEPEKPPEPEKKPEKKEPKPKAAKPQRKETTQEMTRIIDSWSADEVVVLEANVDDVDGEVMGNLFEVLLLEGQAYDVVMIPAYGKKNRPCFVIKVIATREKLESVAEIMIRHLGTLGVRYTAWDRLKAAREIIVTRFEIDDREFMVRVKISRGADGSIINIKPEAEDVIKVAKATGIPVRELKPRIALQAHAVTE